MYLVMCSIDISDVSPDDPCSIEEYTGNRYNTYEEAIPELHKAQAESEQFGFINYAYIKEV